MLLSDTTFALIFWRKRAFTWQINQNNFWCGWQHEVY